MALDDDAVVEPTIGYFYMAPSGTALPVLTDPTTIPTPWVEFGHTSLDDNVSLTRDGDDPEVLGTWQNRKLRTTVPDVTYGIDFTSVQANSETYMLYFGAGSASYTGGKFTIPSRPEPQEKALLLIINDGEMWLPLWYPKVSLLGRDAIAFDAENFLAFPLHGTFLEDPNAAGTLGAWLDAFTPAAG